MSNLDDFVIPLEEIILATGNFSEENQILKQGDCVIYRGQLSEGWKNCKAAFRRYRGDGEEEREAFQNELNFISSLKNDNIIPFIGYCDEGVRDMVIVYEYPVNGSLYDHLKNEDKRNSLTWAQRLSICCGVAKGLKYLHSGVSEHGTIIHLSVMESKILLDNNLNARICGFDLSASIPVDEPDQQVYRPVTRIQTNMDPIYVTTGLVKAASDVFSFGVLLFKMLTSMDALDLTEESTPTDLVELVQRYYDSGLEKFIDPAIKDQTGGRSFNMFNKIAYKCISLNLKDRPTMARIVQTFEEILHINDQGDAPLEEFFIPLKEIILATSNFSKALKIGGGGFGAVYKGKLSERWQKRDAAIKRLDKTGHQGKNEFRNELELISKFHHQNIIPFIGYCDEGDEMILVYEYANNRSLDYHLEDKDMRHCLTWVKRLKICLGAANGLSYLHTGLGEDNRVIHRDVKSGNILLDDKMEAKICDFGLSKSKLTSNQQHTKLYTNAAGTSFYIDPIYHESGVLCKESDVYSFGVVLFEMVSGILAYKRNSFDDGKPQPLIHLVRRYYNKDLGKLVDPSIRDQIKGRSLHILADTAYRCLSFSTEERPSMSKIIKSIEKALHNQDLLIPLKDINLAIGVKTQENRIGGGFSPVYKGQLSERWQNRTVAIKFLSPDSYHGEYEFRNELNMFFRFDHENIIPFIGYCDEGNEKIIVFEYASNGSLDCHLKDTDKRRFLTWEHRLKICLGAATALDYLHSGLREGDSVTHKDVQSANILLDHNLVAKVCGFGLSKSGLVNEAQAQVYKNAAGTSFYMDPVYIESGILGTESDVYSFGVVMFELLSGMLAYNRRKLGDSNPKPLIHIVRYHHNYNPELLIDPLIRDEIDSRSFDTYSKVAFQCISFNTKERPTMKMIVDRIEEALEFHVRNQRELQAKGDAELNHPGSLE